MMTYYDLEEAHRDAAMEGYISESDVPDIDYCGEMLLDAMKAVHTTGNLGDILDSLDCLARAYNGVGFDIPTVPADKRTEIEKKCSLFVRFSEFTKKYASALVSKKGV